MAFAAFTACLLFAPGIAFLSHHYTGWPRYAGFDIHAENRNPNPPPDFQKTAPDEWGKGIEQWYDDRFAWRGEILDVNRKIHHDYLKTPIGREVPGKDGWIFFRGGSWPELDDYLGGFELTEEEKENWLTLFEGRRQWAAAHGIVYLQLITSVKAQVQCEKIPSAIRWRKGVGVGQQIDEAVKGSPMAPHVIFVHDSFRAEVERGRDVFFPVDHHPNAIGQFLIYNELNERIRSFFPQVKPILLDGPTNMPPCCHAPENGRLEVSFPGETNVDASILVADKSSRIFPYQSIVSVRPGPGLYVLMMNDSFMRFTLSSWKEKEGSVRFPLGEGVNRVASFLFSRATTGFMDFVISEQIPDVLVEQFPECRLNGDVIGLDDTIRRAAAFGRGRSLEPSGAESVADGLLHGCAVLEGVATEAGVKSMLEDRTAGPLTVVLSRGGMELATATVYAGVRRAVFFEPFDAKKSATAKGPFSIEIKGGRFSASRLSFSVTEKPRPIEP